MGALLDMPRKGEGEGLLSQKTNTGKTDTDTHECQAEGEDRPPGNQDQVSSELDSNLLESRSRSDTIIGIVCALLSGIVVAVGCACVQSLDESVPHSELNTFRFMAQLVIMAPIMIKEKCAVRVERKSAKWLVVCCVSETVSIYLWFGCAYYIPVGTATSMSYGTILLLELSISCAFFKQCKLHQVLSVCLTLAGIILITQPDFIFPHSGISFHEINETTSNCFSVCEDVNKNTSLAAQIFHQSSSLKSNALNHKAFPNSSLAMTNVADANGTHENLYISWSLNEELSRLSATQKTILGYVMVTSGGIASSARDYIMNRKLNDISMTAYNVYTSSIGTSLSLLVMLVTDTPTWPSCWFCVLMLITHIICASAYNNLWYVVCRLISPVLGTIVSCATAVLGSFVLQYTVLSGLHPGHQNWLEYVGLTSVLCALVVGPVLQACMVPVKNKEEKGQNG